MTKGTIMAAEKTTAAQGSEHPIWNGATAARCLQESVRDGLLKPCRALVLGADMIEEATTLSKLGFEVLVTDTSNEALSRARDAVHAQGGKIGAVHADFFKVRQYFYGTVNLIVERTMLPGLPPHPSRGLVVHGDPVPSQGRAPLRPLPRGARHRGPSLLDDRRRGEEDAEPARRARDVRAGRRRGAGPRSGLEGHLPEEVAARAAPMLTRVSTGG